uniref:Uncharacterized protein n=1 Tax=viral metagenome TaxID=1070528 RepID=A0A6M3L8V1_9ZZZZ
MIEDDSFSFPWLDEAEYQKALGQFRMNVAARLRVFDCHGLGIYIQPVTEAIVELAEDFGMRVRGEDRPIDSNHNPLESPTR